MERSDYFDLISSHKRREPNVFDDNLNSPRLPSKYRYHPLIHTRVEFILAQNMAGDYQGMKSALKYDFQIPTKRIGKSTHLRWHFYCSQRSGRSMLGTEYIILVQKTSNERKSL